MGTISCCLCGTDKKQPRVGRQHIDLNLRAVLCNGEQTWTHQSRQTWMCQSRPPESYLLTVVNASRAFERPTASRAADSMACLHFGAALLLQWPAKELHACAGAGWRIDPLKGHHGHAARGVGHAVPVPTASGAC